MCPFQCPFSSGRGLAGVAEVLPPKNFQSGMSKWRSTPIIVDITNLLKHLLASFQQAPLVICHSPTNQRIIGAGCFVRVATLVCV